MNNMYTTRSIVIDYFNWRLGKETSRRQVTTNRLFSLIRQMAYECERHQPRFNFQFLPSSSSLVNLQNFHYEIARELFNDGIVTWTRIITFISFSAILVEHLNQQQNKDLIISSVIEWTTNFIDRDLRIWLENQNYWIGFLKLYDQTPQQTNTINRYVGILGTVGMLTLGALYMKQI